MDNKNLRRQVAIEDFGTDTLPKSLMREARKIASQCNITTRQALVIAKKNDQKRDARLKIEAKKALRKVLKKKVRAPHPANKKPREKSSGLMKSSWPENDNTCYVLLVSGGLPSLGKKR